MFAPLKARAFLFIILFSLSNGWLQIPAQALDLDKLGSFIQVEIDTSYGRIVVELDGRRAPITVKNFLTYAKIGHYNGTIIHRAMPGFVVQGGGYTRNFEEKKTLKPIFNESGNGLRNRRGSLAMARFDDPHSAQSQFFINVEDNDSLNPNPSNWGYAVFGEVIEGLDVVDKISKVETRYSPELDAQDVPVQLIVIRSVKILEQ